VNGNLYQTSHDEGRIVNGVYEYNITDHNNDLRIAFKDSAGIATPTQSIFYDPWGLSMKGMQITKNSANFNKFQFLNRETQFETGYIDLIHRQFDPQVGRFTSQDPVIEGQEHLSLYQYGWNNPILKPDPDGLVPCCGEAGVAIGGFVTGLGEAVVRNVKALTVNLPQTLQGLGNLANPVGQVQAAVGGAMLYDKTKSDWNTGDTRTRANIIGNVVGEIGIAVAGSKGAGSLGKTGVVAEVAKGGEVAEMVSVYRGVNSTSPAFAAAENGVVKPRGGFLGHSDALTHNTGMNGTANSKMTSWTTNPEVAKNFALRTSGNGIVLSQQVPISSLITSPNLKTINLIQSGGIVSESEVLLKGVQRNLNIERIGQ
jgi:RHS repeat-associated protein